MTSTHCYFCQAPLKDELTFPYCNNHRPKTSPVYHDFNYKVEPCVYFYFSPNYEVKRCSDPSPISHLTETFQFYLKLESGELEIVHAALGLTISNYIVYQGRPPLLFSPETARDFLNRLSNLKVFS